MNTNQIIEDKEEYEEQKEDIALVIKDTIKDISDLLKKINDSAFWRNLNEFNSEKIEDVNNIEEKAKELLNILKSNKNFFENKNK